MPGMETDGVATLGSPPIVSTGTPATGAEELGEPDEETGGNSTLGKPPIVITGTPPAC